MSAPDIELLDRYLADGAEEIFAELVHRHLDMVYSVALRKVGGDEAMARDVAQTVFSDLARKAHTLTKRSSLGGWLYTSAHFAATKAVRGERRRRFREQEAWAMQDLTRQESDATWEEIRPILDSAMHELREADRELLVLRFFERRDLQALGRELGVSADAARKRVDRSLEKLRAVLSRLGVTSSASALGVALSGPALTSAPAGLGAIITNASLSAAMSASSASILSLIMASNKLHLGIASLIVASVATIPLVLQHRNLARLRSENAQARLEIGELQARAEASAAEAARLSEDLQRQQRELARLKGIAARQRSTETTAVAPATPNQAGSQTEAQKFEQLIHYVADLRNRQFGAEPTEHERKWLEDAKPYFKELLKTPALFSQLQTSLIQGVLNLRDEEKLAAIRSVIENSANEVAQQGLLYSANPQAESDDWKRLRFELDRRATKEVQSLLSEDELERFDRRFRGVLLMDLIPRQHDPSFEYIDPILRSVHPDNPQKATLERSPGTGKLVSVAPQPGNPAQPGQDN